MWCWGNAHQQKLKFNFIFCNLTLSLTWNQSCFYYGKRQLKYRLCARHHLCCKQWWVVCQRNIYLGKINLGPSKQVEIFLGGGCIWCRPHTSLWHLGNAYEGWVKALPRPSYKSYQGKRAGLGEFSWRGKAWILILCCSSFWTLCSSHQNGSQWQCQQAQRSQLQ